jgi:hypothetical protein
MSGKVKVFRFKRYHIRAGDFIVSSRMAPLCWIERNDAVAIEGTGIEIDERLLLDDGYTEKNFDPTARKS